MSRKFKSMLIMMSLLMFALPILEAGAEIQVNPASAPASQVSSPVSDHSFTPLLDSASITPETKQQVLVKYKPDSKPATRKSGFVDPSAGEGLELLSTASGQVARAELTESDIEKLKQSPAVELVETDGVVTQSADIYPAFARTLSTHLVHKKGLTGKGIKVAVFDTGISRSNTDLFVKGGVSFVPGVKSDEDDNGHGTTMASILSALQNDRGFIGVAPQAELYAVKVLDQSGKGYYSSIIQGLQWAIENQMQIVVMSFGGFQYSKILEEAIQAAYQHNILIVGAVGNDSATRIHFPAKYNEVLAVGAVDAAGKRASFSNTGDGIDIMAPGTQVITTGIQNRQLYADGTSVSTAIVAGIAAQMLQAKPTLHVDELRALLQKSAVPLPNTSRSEYGWGRVHAWNAYENLNSKLSLNEAERDRIQFIGDDVGKNGTVTQSYLLSPSEQYISVGQSAQVRAGFYSPHAVCYVSEESSSGQTMRSTAYYSVAGNGAYLTYQSAVFTSPGRYLIRYHCPDTNTHAYDDIFTINVTQPAPSNPPTAIPTSIPITPTSAPTTPTSPPATSVNIAVDSSIAGHIAQAGQVFTYRFTAPTSGSYTITTTGQTDTYGHLLNASGSELASNDDSNGGNNFKIVHTLVANDVYVVKVRHYSSTGTGSYTLLVSSPAQASTPADDYGNTPATATNIMLNQTLGGQIDYSGDVDVFRFTPSTTGDYSFFSSGATDVYGHLLNASGTEIASNDDVDGTTNFRIIFRLTAGQVYFVKVRHYNPTLRGSYSFTVKLAPDTQAPTAPTNLRSPSSTTTTISLAWEASTDNVGVTGYEVYRYKDQASAKELLSTIKPPLTSCTDQIAGLNSTYNYVIVAIDAAGNRSKDSNVIKANTIPVDVEPPTKPTNLKITSSPTSVTLSWTASTDNVGVTNYEIYRNGTKITTVSQPVYTDTAVSPNASYEYDVKARDAAGNVSDSSARVMAYTTSNGLAPPGTPTGTSYGNMGWGYMYEDASTFSYIISGFNPPDRQPPTDPHYAIDIVSKSGASPIYGVPVKNVYAGKVIISNKDVKSSAGYFVVVETDSIDPITKNKLYVRYLHLREAPLVKLGTRINKGDLIGYTGNTGSVSPTPDPNNPRAGTHLHIDVNNVGKLSKFELYETINPQMFFPNIPFAGQMINLN